MEDNKEEEIKYRKLRAEYAKDISILVLACSSFLAGVILTFCGLMSPPVGEIDGSVLGGLGQFLTFSGALLGIIETGYIQMKKIKYFNPDSKDDDDKYASDLFENKRPV